MLNERQKKFVREYIKTNNATQSAISAGYSKKTATPEVERDKELYKKYTYMYKILKSMYPHTPLLSDDEIGEMVQILRKKGEGFEDSLPYLEEYISKHEPEWKTKYFAKITPEKNKSKENVFTDKLNNAPYYIANRIWNSALGDITYGANRTLNGLPEVL